VSAQVALAGGLLLVGALDVLRVFDRLRSKPPERSTKVWPELSELGPPFGFGPDFPTSRWPRVAFLWGVAAILLGAAAFG
jgi:hypothetical protein